MTKPKSDGLDPANAEHNSVFRRNLLLLEIQDLNRIAVERGLEPHFGDLSSLSVAELRSVAKSLVRILRTPVD